MPAAPSNLPVLRLRPFPRLAALTAGWLLAGGALLANPLSVNVQASRNRIYLGESVQLHVGVDGSSDRDLQPRFPALQGAKIALLGSQDNSSRSIQIINGRMTQEVRRGRTFVYQLTPEQAGRLDVGPVEIQQQSNIAMARGPVIEVVGVEQRPEIAVTVEATRQTILVDEPFSITLRIRVAALAPPNERIEPLHPSHPPHLQADFLELAEIRGLKQPDLKNVLEKLVSQDGRAPAFRLNNYQSQGMGGFMGFGSLFEPQPIRFRLPAQPVTHNGQSFWEYRLALNYTAQNEGDYTFGPVTFKGVFIKGGDTRGQPVLEEVFTIGPAVTVRVVPPPETGRPEWFIGSVGRNLEASASLDTAICKVGDPLTLTLDITGELSLSNLRPPVLGLHFAPEVAEMFRIYSEPYASESIAGGKRFRYRMRPLKPGTLEFPAIPIAYFDTERMQYVTVHTLPLPVQAHATTQIATASEEEDAANGGTQALTAAAKQPDGLIGARNGEHGPRTLAPTARRAITALAVPPLVFILTALLRGAWRRRRAWAAARRRGRALPRARRTLRQARRAAASAPVQGAILGAQAFRTYCSSRLGISGQGVTANDLDALFHAHGLAEFDRAASIQTTFAELEQLPFRPHAATAEGVDERLARLLADLAALDRHLARTSRRKRAVPGRALLCVLAVSLPLAGRSDRLPDAFTWERANQAAAGARTPEGFLAAANIYNDLVRDGARTGALFYNLGTVLLLAGDARNAEAALVRAERHLGATPEIRTNLRLAIGARTGQPDAPLPPSRVFLAWHYFLSLDLRIWLTLAGWGLFWLGLALRLATPPPATKFSAATRRRTFANLLAGWGGALLILYGGSVALTLIQEQHDTRFWHERVFTIPGAKPAPEASP